MAKATAAEDEDVVVAKSTFDREPRRFICLASPSRHVIVKHDGTDKISAVFGGSLNVLTGEDVTPISR